MNLAVHGIEGDLRQAITTKRSPTTRRDAGFAANLHQSTGRFDFVLANPPFNVDAGTSSFIPDPSSFPLCPFGLPRTDNANYKNPNMSGART